MFLIGFSHKNKKIYNGTSKNDFLLKANVNDNNNESSKISNSSEVKNHIPVFAMMWLETQI